MRKMLPVTPVTTQDKDTSQSYSYSSALTEPMNICDFKAVLIEGNEFWIMFIICILMTCQFSKTHAELF